MSEPRNSDRPEDRAGERPGDHFGDRVGDEVRGRVGDQVRGDSPAPDPLGDIRTRISELIDYFLYYISARIDTLRLALRRRIFIASWIAIAVLAAAGAIITGVVMLCAGICDGLSVLFGHRWAGELVTGGLLLACVAAGGSIAVGKLVRGSQLKSMAKYEAMRQKEREQFGRSAIDGDGDRHG